MKLIIKMFVTMFVALSLAVVFSGCLKKAEPGIEVTTYETPQDTKDSGGGMNISTGNKIDMKVESYEAKKTEIELTPVEQAKLELADNLATYDAETIGKISEEKLEEIMKTKESLLNDLEIEFKAKGIKITVDKLNGDVVLDSSVLFDTDESEVSGSGKDFLKEFLPVYTSVIFNEKYKDFISQVVVEGHTDTDGSYDYNMKLSQDRADNVKDFCKSDESGISGESKDSFNSVVVSKGFSYDRPVTDSNGNVDMQASRRVTFRFLINLDV